MKQPPIGTVMGRATSPGLNGYFDICPSCIELNKKPHYKSDREEKVTISSKPNPRDKMETHQKRAVKPIRKRAILPEDNTPED